MGSKYKPQYNNAEQEFMGSLRALLKRYGVKLIKRVSPQADAHFEIIRLRSDGKDCIYLSIGNLVDEVGEEIVDDL